MGKKIGVLTSGGDAPGMNAALRAIVRTGINLNIEVYGINHGYQGLIDDDMQLMDIASVGNIIHRGGTIIKTARSEEFKTPEGRQKALKTIEKRSLDALILIGGDGTLLGARELDNLGINVFHLPGTIDNDLGYSDYSIGFDTAVNTILGAINNIRETGMAHDKITVIEVMGRDCGDLALRSGLTGGADIILIPEVENTIDEVVCKIKKGIERNKKNSIIIRAEGSPIKTEDIAKAVKEETGETIRNVVLGYLQRGGSPTGHDRMIATLMGVYAVELVSKDEKSKVIGFVGNDVATFEIEKAISLVKREVDLRMLEIIDELA